MLNHWVARPLSDLLAHNGLSGTTELPFPNDGWSGATLTQFVRQPDRARFILKRTSWAQDWIARATRDHALREGFVATGQLSLPASVVAPYLGAAADGTAVAMLMPDLSDDLLTWERGDGAPTMSATMLDRVLAAIADLHSTPVHSTPISGDDDWPWCPLRERLLLLSPSSAMQLTEDGVAAGARFMDGWAAFDQLTTPDARELVARLDADPDPLLAALATQPGGLLHGDLKVANIAPLADGRTAFIDWQMVMIAPVAVDLGWFVVSNSSALSVGPLHVLERYRSVARVVSDGDWATTRDLAMILGLLLRGWRKGLDAQAGDRLASGIDAAEDLRWWCDAAVDAAGRRL
ncbi:MAG: aminoglycoside phosphotransferase family protein [Candidatus Limnocylindrales bacterium]